MANVVKQSATIGGIGIIAAIITAKLMEILIPAIGSVVVVEGVDMLKVGQDIIFSLETIRGALLVAVLSGCTALASYLKSLYEKYVADKLK